MRLTFTSVAAVKGTIPGKYGWFSVHLLIAIFIVGVAGLQAQPEFDPAAIFLTWQQDPTSTMTIDWHTTPDQPIRLGALIDTRLRCARGIYRHPMNDYVYVAVGHSDGDSHTNSSLVVNDISDPATPVFISETKDEKITAGSELFISGSYLYMSGFRDHLVKIFEYSNSSSTDFVIHLEDDRLRYPRGISGNDRYLFVNSSGNKSIVAFDITNPAVPVKAGSIFHPFLTGVRQSTLVENRLFVTSWQGSGVFLVDVSSPEIMQLIDSQFHHSLSGVYGITARDNYIYATATVTGGLVVLEYY